MFRIPNFDLVSLICGDLDKINWSVVLLYYIYSILFSHIPIKWAMQLILCMQVGHINT